jgi:hypothetical protein
MIGLDFVKKIDKDWKKNIKFTNIKEYKKENCPFCGCVLNNIY